MAWILTAITAAAVCGSLIRTPLQVTDSLVPILAAQTTPSIGAAIAQGFSTTNYLRPLRAAQIQAIFELAHGRYFLSYKAFHALFVLICFALFVVLLDADTPRRLVVVPFALTVLTGLHTFRGTVWEAFPVNHSLEVVAFCLLALVLCRSKGGWWVDAAAALAFVVASLTVESGLLVWVVVVAAWLAGARGVSTRGLALITLLLAGYLWLRFGYLATGAPDLAERGSGFGLHQMEPAEIVRRFSDRRYVFYAYNVVSALLGVLVSEPRSGIWTMPAEALQGRIAAGTAINVASSVVVTSVIAWFALTRVRSWWHRHFDRDDQVIFVALAVIGANAAIGYAYAKDEVMGPGGVFYALAAFVAIVAALQRAAEMVHVQTARVAALGLVLAVAAGGWTVRAAGLHYQMHVMAFYDRNEWVYVDRWLQDQRSSPTTGAGKTLVRELREDAIERFTVNPYLLSPRLEQWFR